MRTTGELEGKIETGVELDGNGKVNQREIHAFSCLFLAGVCVYIYIYSTGGMVINSLIKSCR